MFFDLIRRNSKRDRKENGIFFASLIVSIIAFYIILSLRNQDVIIFLQTMESDAVDKLLGLIPALYGASLFILFFLIYFASKYQFERRSHELGIYMMMGMKRSRLFLLLLAEDALNSVIALLAGIPAAVFLSELISLVTAKLVGLGIIGHRFTFSMWAVLITIAGFFIIKSLAFAILTFRFAGKEISELLAGSQDQKEKVRRPKTEFLKLAVGVLMTGTAYWLAIMGLAWSSLPYMAVTAALGISGTFLFFYGLSAWIEIILKRTKKDRGLRVYTFRQLQENVICRTSSMAVSSLLALMALCCFGYGFSSAWSAYTKPGHVIHYTFEGSGEAVKGQLEKPPLSDYIEEFFEVRMGLPATGDSSRFQADGLLSAISNLEDSSEKDTLLNNFTQLSSDTPYLISLSGYNHILELSGEEPLVLEEGQAAIYYGADFTSSHLTAVLDESLSSKPALLIDGREYQLLERSYSINLVADRLINIFIGLIVADDDFDMLLPKDSYISSYWNAALSKEMTEESGLMQVIMEVNGLLDETGLIYESYLQNIGRQLFYLTASSYTTIYLALILLIIANTVLGVQFLMQQKKTGRRNQILINLGCDYNRLRRSARIQIKWYFACPLITAVISSIFGVKSLFSGLLSPSMKGDIFELSMISTAMIVLLCVVEYFYISAVMRLSDKHILDMMHSSREE